MGESLTLVLCGPLYLCYENGSSAKEQQLFSLFDLGATPLAGALLLALADGSQPALEWVASWLGEPSDYAASLGRWRAYQPWTFDHGRGFAKVVAVEFLAGHWKHYRYSVLVQRPSLFDDDETGEAEQ